jgi:hypothetical protein
MTSRPGTPRSCRCRSVRHNPGACCTVLLIPTSALSRPTNTTRWRPLRTYARWTPSPLASLELSANAVLLVSCNAWIATAPSPHTYPLARRSNPGTRRYQPREHWASLAQPTATSQAAGRVVVARKACCSAGLAPRVGTSPGRALRQRSRSASPCHPDGRPSRHGRSRPRPWSPPSARRTCRSASGGIASSPAATRYHDGSDLHAGTPITSPSVEVCRGCCTAYTTLALTGSISPAK